MIFEVTILGSSSATPAYQRNPTSQVMNLHDKMFMIDCGEGTQMQLIRYKVRFHRINHIFISHLHGDHYLGLMGLLSTMHLQGRTAEVHLYAHAALEEIIYLQLRISETQLRFPIVFHPLPEVGDVVLFEDDDLSVETLPLEHRIPCKGFLFREKLRNRSINTTAAKENDVPVSFYRNLKNGLDYTDASGKVIANALLTFEPRIPRSYAYCSDTIFAEHLIDSIKGVDLLYHESTFLNDLRERAIETYHTTARQAGMIAARANVKQLLLGHFSARYRDLEPFLNEARTEFENTSLALEGEKFSVA